VDERTEGGKRGNGRYCTAITVCIVQLHRYTGSFTAVLFIVQCLCIKFVVYFSFTILAL